MTYVKTQIIILFLALHNMDPSKADMKTVIRAVNFCFLEKSIFNEKVKHEEEYV